VAANGGFFLTNLLSLLQPTPLTLTTPPELLPYGWTATDLWCAPTITGLYALLTHAQPFWTEAHTLLVRLIGGVGGVGGVGGNEKVVPAVDPDTARATCAFVLVLMFTTRTVRAFRKQNEDELARKKEKTQ
jgi:hypothetical protein